MTLKLSTIPRAYHIPQPNWQTIRGWIEEKIPEAEKEQAWWDIADDWLATLVKELGGDYRIEKTDNLLLLTPLGRSQSAALLRFGEAALAAIIHELGTLAFENWYGPLVVLHFGDGATYYAYISPFFPEGEFGGSGGVCIRSSGFVHIALHPATGEQSQAALAHEIAHAALSHLQMPLWLEEGITQLAEEEGLPDRGRFTLGAETAGELRKYWREHGLADFWWGKGFFLANEGQEFSYLLAQVLFRLLSADHKESLAEFVRSAHVDDAGESAAREFLGLELSEVMTKFLGEGNWAAIPMDGAGFCRRGLLFASQGKIEQACRISTRGSGSIPSWRKDTPVEAPFIMGRSNIPQRSKITSRRSGLILGISWLITTSPGVTPPVPIQRSATASPQLSMQRRPVTYRVTRSGTAWEL